MTQKFGFQSDKQRYYCHPCKRYFIDKRKLDIDVLWQEYVYGKQTLN
jgi:transposase-like protein